MISRPPGACNVRSLLSGSGAVAELDLPTRDFLVTTMEVPWRICRPRLPATPRAVLMADRMDRAAVEAQVTAAPEAAAVVAIGGGRAIDLGKYLAWRRGLRLITIPTVLSVDAFVTPAAGLREEGRVVYLGEATPDPLVIDYELLRTAPAGLNVAGVGDLLSIHTAVDDWRRAAARGRSEYPFSEEDCRRAETILARVMRRGDAIRTNSDEGLAAIVEGYLDVNRLCLPAGHYRVEEGSEHYLFYELEERTGRPFVHGPIIGLGIDLMSRLQENRPAAIATFMAEVGLDYRPASLGLDRRILRDSLTSLPAYVRARDDLWFTVIDEADLGPTAVEALLDSLPA